VTLRLNFARINATTPGPKSGSAYRLRLLVTSHYWCFGIGTLSGHTHARLIDLCIAFNTSDLKTHTAAGARRSNADVLRSVTPVPH
jgi:hypothetical protein